MRRVAITGIGCLTAAGHGVDGLWAGLQTGRSPVRRIDRFDASPFRSRIAAQIDDFRPEEALDPARSRRWDRYSQFAVAAARQALADAGLDPRDPNADRVAVLVGSALGGVAFGEAQTQRYLNGGVRAVDPSVALSVFVGAASCNIAIEFGFTGPNIANGMSCASGAIAIGEAWRLLRSGEADVALAGGVEAPLAPLSFGAFAIIRAMSTRNEEPERACRPFDAERDGFVMGEGAAILVLEAWEHAVARGARIYAELRGYACTNDAHHMTAPRPDGAQAARAMRLALANAGLPPDAIDCINAHGSSTPLNDRTESQAIRAVFGSHADRVRVTATKPFTGHALGASGAIEAAISALSIARGWVPPILNLDRPEEGCDLAFVRGAGCHGPVHAVLSNSFGFGGINAVLVLTAPVGP